MTASLAICTIALASIAGIIFRPLGVAEALWPVLGAVLITCTGLLPWQDSLAAVGRGTDVYLFLTGMMLLAELARREGLFEWLAAHAARRADGSPHRLFLITYCIGTVVTVFLSNDATAVVLTPAVYAAVRATGAQPLPFLYVCAFVANAASFVLPISNPANLVVFNHEMPSLFEWLLRFSLPSLAAIVATFVLLRLSQDYALKQPIRSEIAVPKISRTGYACAAGVSASALMLLTASALKWDLGLPTFCAALLTWVAIMSMKRERPTHTLRGISWSVLPLVAGLFVLVEAIHRIHIFEPAIAILKLGSDRSLNATAAGAGAVVASLCNVTNNLPLGVIVGTVFKAAELPGVVGTSLLIGVDLGPNLSVTGSLATILWLLALRREGLDVSAFAFLRLGFVVMIPTLAASLAAAFLAARYIPG